MKKDVKIKAGVLLLFTLFTFIQIFPLAKHPTNSLNDTGDCLLNTWIISWVQEHLFKNPLKLFDANIFYPLSNTLSFSEHLFPQALLSLPVYFISKNPVLVYNFVFFFSCLLSAYGMFLLVRYLTKNNFAGIACGFIFSFNSYQMNHLPHLQLFSLGLIPLSFLYLHKFLEDKNVRNSILFSVFFTLQALACVYYGLFFISIMTFILPIFLILHYRELKISFLIKLGIPLIFSGLVLYIFSLPYLSLFRTYGFKRGLMGGADLINYLAANPRNIFLGKKLSSLGTHERFLFPGIAVLILVGFYIFQKRDLFRNIPKIFKIFMVTFFFINLITIFIMILTGGFTLDLKLFSISAHNLANPTLINLIIMVLWLVCSFLIFIFKQKNDTSEKNQNFFLYIFLLIWGLFLSFGSSFTFLGNSTSILPLPFAWFYNRFPGFMGIRVPSRFAVFVIFSVTILAGYGLKFLLEMLKKKPLRASVIGILILFLNLEYLSIPQRIRFIPIKDNIPPTYKWLKDRQEDFSLIEIPFHDSIGRDSVYLYFSLFHGKKLVNGYSGFIPPEIFYIRGVFKRFPDSFSLEILKSLRVKYVVLHPNIWKEEIAARKMQRIQDRFKTDLKLVKKFMYNLKKPADIFKSSREDFVYEVILGEEEKKEKMLEVYEEITPECEIKASTNDKRIPFLKDNNPKTRWTTGRGKKTGDFLLLEFEKPLILGKVSLHLGSFPYDFALDIRTETSLDGKEWKKIGRDYYPSEFLENLIYSPLEPIQNIYLRGRKLRYLKLTQIGDDRNYWWSVAELKIYK